MKPSGLEAKLIKVRRTIALDLKAISDLEHRIAKKRRNIEALQDDERELSAKFAKAKR